MTDPWDLRLDGKSLDVILDQGVQSATRDLTITGASTMTIDLSDPEDTLRSSGILDHDDNGRLDSELVVTAGTESFELFGLQKGAGHKYTLTLEDEVVARLRRQTGRLQVNGTDDVAFARRLVSQVGAELVVPTGAAVTAATTAAKRAAARQDADVRRERGLPDDGGLTIKGAKASSEQLRNVETALTVADQQRAPGRAVLAMMVAGIGESNFRAVKNPGSKYAGVFQADPANVPKDDTEKQAFYFLTGGKGFQQGGAIKLAKANPSMSPGEIATRVEASGKPGSFYQQHAEEGRKLIAAWGGVKTSTATTTAALARGTAEDPDEDSWTALQRIAGVLGKRCFAYNGRVYWAREQDLILSRARLTISRDTDGVNNILWESVPRKQVNKATVNCRARMWTAPPGSVVVLQNELLATGRWLVARYSTRRHRPDAVIELVRGTELLRPEAPTASPRSQLSFGVGPDPTVPLVNTFGTQGGAKGIVDRCVKLAQVAGGTGVYVGSGLRPGSTTTSGNRSDHGRDDSIQAARDIGVRGIDLLVGPPSPKLDAGVVAIGRAFGRDYGNGRKTIVDTFQWRGYRVQIIWRTPAYGGHLGHIHIGVRR